MLDSEIKHYIKSLRENGAALIIFLVQAATEGYLVVEIVLSLSASFGIGPDFQMGFVQKKGGTKANVQLLGDRFKQIIASFLSQIVALVKAHSILPELLINLDETGITLSLFAFTFYPRELSIFAFTCCQRELS